MVSFVSVFLNDLQNLTKRLKKILIPLLLFYVFSSSRAQGFDHFPTLNGDLEEWFSGLTGNSETAIMKGIYHYDEKEELISPHQTPFYKTGWDYFGKITYEGRVFPRIDIIYNTSEDLLLVRNPKMEKDGERSLLISQSKIDSFTIHNDKFLYFKHAKIGKRGFYKLVMRGRSIQCFAKETKMGQPKGSVYEFNENTNFYIRYKNQIHTYRQASSLYKIFPNQKKELKRYIGENLLFRLSRKNKESFLNSVLNYCDSIVE